MERIRRRLDGVLENARHRGHQRLADAIELFVELCRQLLGERVLRTSAALAFTSILALVPLLAVSFAVLRAFLPHGEVADTIRSWMLSTLLADSVSGVVTYLQQFLEETRSGALGLVGLTFLIVTSLALFLSVERAVNSIWRVRISRPLYRRLVTFYAVITLTPAFIGLGFLSAGWIVRALEAPSIGITLSGFVSSALVLTGLTLMYKLMPHAHVRWRYAMMGGFWAALIFQVSRLCFNVYVESIYSGSVTAKIYGSFSLVPVFFLWLHLIWIIILSGVTISYMLQNKARVAWVIRRRRSGQESYIPVSPDHLLRTMLVIADGFRHSGGGTSVQAMCETLGCESVEAEDALHLLRAGGLIVRVTESENQEVIPAKPLEQVGVLDILKLAAEAPGQKTPTAVPVLAELDHVLRQAQDVYDQKVSGLSVEAILEAAQRKP